MQNKEKHKNSIVGNYYYYSDTNIGSAYVEGKGKRPYYILCGVDNHTYFGVVSTKSPHKGRKNTFQDKQYIENDLGSYLRLDGSIGFTIFKKEEIKNNMKDLKKGNLPKEEIDNLLKFYSYDINQKKRDLKKD